MPTLSIKKDVDFGYIEERLNEIESQKYEQLRIPSKIKFSGGLGIEVALVQLITTWARDNESGRLLTYYDQSDISELSVLCNSLYGLVTLAISPTIHFENGDRLPKSEAMAGAVEMMRLISGSDFKNAFKGKKVFFPCLKSGSYDGNIKPLYVGENIASERGFFNFFIKAVEAVIPEKGRREGINDSYLRNMSYITRQLFKNTHEHAVYDEYGNDYLRNVRGISINQQSYTSSDLMSLSSSSGELEKYLSNLAGEIEPGVHKHFLEVSIFDAGPGFAGRWLGESQSSLTAEKQSAAVLECFKKYSGTKNQSSSGQGLNLVIDELTLLNGFFRLRTGKVLVEKGFSNKTSDQSIDYVDIQSMKSNACGSTFTFIVPIA